MGLATEAGSYAGPCEVCGDGRGWTRAMLPQWWQQSWRESAVGLVTNPGVVGGKDLSCGGPGDDTSNGGGEEEATVGSVVRLVSLIVGVLWKVVVALGRAVGIRSRRNCGRPRGRG